MSETKHTPGPWCYIVNIKGKFGIYPEGEKLFLTLTDHEANARLIAAAPELLEVCKQVCGRSDVSCGLPRVISNAQAAIAKAEGETK